MKTINRFQEIPHEGPMCEYLWSEPEDIKESAQNPIEERELFLAVN